MSGNCVTIQWRIQDFPLGGGAPTSDAYIFWRKNMRKRKKLILLGGGALAAPPGSANAIGNFQVDKLGLLEKQDL